MGPRWQEHGDKGPESPPLHALGLKDTPMWATQVQEQPRPLSLGNVLLHTIGHTDAACWRPALQVDASLRELCRSQPIRHRRDGQQPHGGPLPRWEEQQMRIDGVSSGHTGPGVPKVGQDQGRGRRQEDMNEGLQARESGPHLPPVPVAWRWACYWLSHLRGGRGPAEDTGDPGSSTSCSRTLVPILTPSNDSIGRLLTGQMSNVNWPGHQGSALTESEWFINRRGRYTFRACC